MKHCHIPAALLLYYCYYYVGKLVQLVFWVSVNAGREIMERQEFVKGSGPPVPIYFILRNLYG